MSRHVLVVDDSASMRALVCAALKALGFQTTEAANGEEALQCLSTMKNVDMVVTDLNMPVMDGLAFVQNLRRLSALQFTPVLMLTTDKRTAQQGRAKAAGVTGWLTKPFDPQQLAAVVQRVLP
jgi:two-component system chemotaxis response regulator CheY